MPTPRYHGGAPLVHLPMVLPGFRGLNTQGKGSLLGPEWATRLQNTVIDKDGRLAARKGWNSVTTTPHGKDFISGIEFRKGDGTVELLATTEDEVVVSSNNGGTWSDVTGTADFDNGNWFLFTFNDTVIGLQKDKSPLLYNGSISSHISDNGNEPQGGVGIAAFGRVWASDTDGVTLKYSALLDATDWSSQDAGDFDLSTIWQGVDTITAVAAYNNVLVVFGQRNIVVFADGSGSEVGLDPTTMQVVDTIPGIGCLSQHSVQHVGGDLWFVSNASELCSFERVLVEQKSGNIRTLSTHVSDALRDAINNGSFSINDMRSAYSPQDRLYLLSLSTGGASSSSVEGGQTFAFDTRGLMDDGTARCVGVWNWLVPRVFWVRDNGNMLMAVREVVGEAGQYTRQQDNGDAFRMAYESGWQNMVEGSGYQIILKRINGLFYLDAQTEAIIKWAFDFDTRFNSRPVQFAHVGSSAEYGVAEYGIAEYGGGVTLGDKRVAGRGTGEYIKVGVEATIDGATFAIQQMDVLAKVGRLR